MKYLLRSVLASRGARQFVKFSAVGCLNAFVSLVVFYLCYEQWHVGTLILEGIGRWGDLIVNSLCSTLGITDLDGAFANMLGYTAGMVNSFVFNRMWTFEARTGVISQARRFVILNIFCLFFSTIIIFIFVDFLEVPYIPVWVTTYALVTALNFLGNKYWTFIEIPKNSNQSLRPGENSKLVGINRDQ